MRKGGERGWGMRREGVGVRKGGERRMGKRGEGVG
jgi:hypothetical protein